MARIRALKIGFFTNEDLCALPFQHRLLFEGLWLLADREGRLEDRPRRIAVQLFPYNRELDVDAMLTDLSTAQFISRYVVDGGKFIQVNNFLTHQRPHHTEPVSNIPSPADKTPDVHRPTPLGREGKGKEGNGEGGVADAALGCLWNLHCGALPQCKELNATRQRLVHQRLNDRPLEQWVAVIDRIARSPFCNGHNDRGWRATFDWMLKPDTAAKVLEGKYDHFAKPERTKVGSAEYSVDWSDECQTLHGGTCENRYQHELAKVPA